MLKLKFRVYRKLWLVSFTLVSLANLVLSLSVYDYYARKTDVCVLVAISGVAFLISLCALASKWIIRSFVPTLVAVECLWTTCLVPLTMIISLYSLTLTPAPEYASVTWPFMVIRGFSWSLTGIVATYPTVLLTLAFATAATVDKEVWYRDTTQSPSPFPLALVFYLWRIRLGLAEAPEGEETAVHHQHCMPGCGCAEKLPPPSPTLPPLPVSVRSPTSSSAESVVPGIRVPTPMERHNRIVVGFSCA